MIHIRRDDYEDNRKNPTICGLMALPEGDTFFWIAESASRRADCQICNPGGPQQLGTPLSQLSGRPGQPGYEAFKRIAASWGYD